MKTGLQSAYAHLVEVKTNHEEEKPDDYGLTMLCAFVGETRHLVLVLAVCYVCLSLNMTSLHSTSLVVPVSFVSVGG